MTTQSKLSEEEEDDDGFEDREASSADDVDSSHEQVPPRVSSGRAIAAPDTGGPSTISRVFF